MEKQIYILNGMGGCGKDTFASFLSEVCGVFKYSSIDRVKQIAYECGWDGGKTEKDRKFLSDLKCLLTDYNDLPFNDVRNRIEEFMFDEDKFVMQFIADNINLLIKRGKLVFEDLYLLGEQEILNMLKKENISTCIETNASLKDTEKLIDAVDYMIADFKSPNKEILKSVTGADIEIIKENLLKRALSQKYLLIRIPLINTFNTGEENAREFASFFKELHDKSGSNEIYIEILTYHEYGKDKYKKENLEYNFSDGFVTQNQVDILKTELEKNNLKIIKT
jgi:hypothetical protein